MKNCGGQYGLEFRDDSLETQSDVHKRQHETTCSGTKPSVNHAL